MSTTQMVITGDEIERRKGRWHFLSPENRMAGTVWHGMCPEGRTILTILCAEDEGPLASLYEHYSGGKCITCKEAFLPHFLTVTA